RQEHLVFHGGELALGYQISFAGALLAAGPVRQLRVSENLYDELRPRASMKGQELGNRRVVDAPAVPVGQGDAHSEALGHEARVSAGALGERRRRGGRGRARPGRRDRRLRFAAGEQGERRGASDGAGSSGYTLVSHSTWDVSVPRTTSKKRDCSRRVMGPM